MQNTINNLPDIFTVGKDVTKSYIPARNMLERIEVPNKTIHLPFSGKSGRSTAIPAGAASRKRNRKGKEIPSRPASATQQPAERSGVDRDDPPPASIVHTFSDAGTSECPDGIVLGNSEPSRGIQEISINYLDSGETYDHKTTVVDIYFSELIAENLHKDPEPKSMAECKRRSDWDKWKEAIDAELASLAKREVFSSVIPTPPKTFPAGFKWVFIQKWNENNEVVRYKARLVAQGFTQRPGFDFNETYSPVMSGITFRYLISLAVQKRLSMCRCPDPGVRIPTSKCRVFPRPR